MLRNNADARRCSNFELGLPVVLQYFAVLATFLGSSSAVGVKFSVILSSSTETAELRQPCPQVFLVLVPVTGNIMYYSLHFTGYQTHPPNLGEC